MSAQTRQAALVQYQVTGDLIRLLKSRPLGLLPVVNKPLVQHWLEALARLRVTDVTLVLSDYPEQVRLFVGDGARWGFASVNYISLARLDDEGDFYRRCGGAVSADCEVFSMNGFPGEDAVLPLRTLAEYWTCNITAQSRLEHRYGVTEEIYVAPLAQCDNRCRLEGRVHIANQSRVNEQCSIRDCILGHGTEIGAGTTLEETVILPDTRVSDNLHLHRMLVDGGLLFSVDTGECLEIYDEHLVSPIVQTVAGDSLLGRSLAGLLWFFTLPLQIPFYLSGSVRETRLNHGYNGYTEGISLELLDSANPCIAKLPWLKQAALGKLPLFGVRQCAHLPDWAVDQRQWQPGVISLADITLSPMAGADEIAVSNSYQMNSEGLLDTGKLLWSWLGSLFGRNPVMSEIQQENYHE